MNLSALGFISVIFFSVVFTSCKKSDNTNQPLRQMDMQRVSYGSDTAQNMDIYLPAGRDTANTKVIVFIHGGSWNSGDKNEFTAAIAAIRTQLPDFAMFNMNYRLAQNTSTRFPVQINDVQFALNFIAGKQNDYQINVNKICLVGASAGAQLALLQAYKYNAESKIKAVVDLFGPADLADLYNHHPFPAEARPVLVNYLGATPTTNPDIYFQASPINFINAQSVPTKIFHGADDMVVPIAQSNALKAKLDTNKVKADMTIYQGEGHGWFDNNLQDTYQKTIAFIKENVN